MDLMSHPNGQLDSRIEIVTPENIALEYRVAGPFRRLPAYLIDLVICGLAGTAALAALTLLFTLLGLPEVGWGLSLVLWFVLNWFYGGVFETFWNGQTPGKRIMAIRVLSIDGRPINGLQAVLRNVLRAADAQPIAFYVVGLVAAAANRRFQRLGDLVCGTMVVVEEPGLFRGVVRISEPAALALAAQIPAGFQASRSLARALATYVQRRGQLLLARRIEIARHVAGPLRDRFQLAANTDLDQLLCGLYHRTFIAERPDAAAGSGVSPFADHGHPPPRNREAVDR